jgi:hypothetical protein
MLATAYASPDSVAAHHVYPCPSSRIIPPILPHLCKQRHGQYREDAGPPDGEHRPTRLLPGPHLEVPYPREELAVYNHAHDSAMCCEEEVVEAHRGGGVLLVSVCILRANRGGVEEGGR